MKDNKGKWEEKIFNKLYEINKIISHVHGEYARMQSDMIELYDIKKRLAQTKKEEREKWQKKLKKCEEALKCCEKHYNQ